MLHEKNSEWNIFVYLRIQQVFRKTQMCQFMIRYKKNLYSAGEHNVKVYSFGKHPSRG